MTKLSIIALMVLAALSTGCATIVSGGGPNQSVKLNSTPAGATVYVDGNMLGKTPIAATLTRSDNHQVRMELNGKTQTKEIKSGFNGWLFGNILFGGIPGLIVDGVSGTMDGNLSPRNVHLKFDDLATNNPSAPTNTLAVPSTYQPRPQGPAPTRKYD